MTKSAFLFPGQGAQYVGMAKTLVETVPAARQRFDEASAILGYDLLALCLNGPEARLNATDISQPSIFVASLAALDALAERDPAAADTCVATAGLSLGEYTALVFAGAIAFADGVRLVQQRGQAMQAAAEANAGSMVSILGLEAGDTEALVLRARSAGRLWVANWLCPGNYVASGDIAACDALEKLAAEVGARTIRLAVAGAFHTELMKPADQTLAKALERVEIRVPRVPVWSNVDARPHTEPAEIRELLVRQVLEPVLWETLQKNLLGNGVERFYELGPKRVLAGLMKRVQRKTDFHNVEA